jgi:hypothetical protein
MPANDYSSDNQEPQPAAGRARQWPAFVLLIDGVPTGRIDADQMIEVCAATHAHYNRHVVAHLRGTD